jgi:MraZ protein
MAVFLSTVENKVDRKGRVSVPAPFRASLTGQNFHGIVVFPSFKSNAIEACAMDFMERLSDSVGALDLFSDEQDNLASLIFAASSALPFDGEGRVIIPPAMLGHASISDRAVFVGRGETFQIWAPDTFSSHSQSAYDHARQTKPVLKLRPRDGGET